MGLHWGLVCGTASQPTNPPRHLQQICAVRKSIMIDNKLNYESWPVIPVKSVLTVGRAHHGPEDLAWMGHPCA